MIARLSKFIALSVIFFGLFFVLSQPNQTYAQQCDGDQTCGINGTVCNPVNCILGFDVPCSCNTQCFEDGTTIGCTGNNELSCTASECGIQSKCQASNSCIWRVAPTTAPTATPRPGQPTNTPAPTTPPATPTLPPVVQYSCDPLRFHCDRGGNAFVRVPGSGGTNCSDVMQISSSGTYVTIKSVKPDGTDCAGDWSGDGSGAYQGLAVWEYFDSANWQEVGKHFWLGYTNGVYDKFSDNAVIKNGTSSVTFITDTSVPHKFVVVPGCVTAWGNNDWQNVWNDVKNQGCYRTINTTGVNSTPTPTLTPIPPCTIQGYKVVMPSNRNILPASVQTITFDGVNTNINQPYFQSVVPGTHTVSTSVPSGYYVGYSSCENATNCHTNTPIFGSTASVNCPAGGYNDLWFHYYEIGTPRGGGWIKLKDASYHGIASIINFIIPNVAQAYDRDDNTQPYFDIDHAGVISANGTIDFGIAPNVKSSVNEWERKSYVRNTNFLTNPTAFTAFITYAKARKSVKIITDIVNAETGKVNILTTGDLTITQTNANALPDKSVLIVQGNVTIANRPGTNHTFNPSSKSIAIIATGTITVDAAYTGLNGIFIAQGFNFGSSNQPLKISGNLISATEIPFARERVDTIEKPTFFIVFNPQMYLDLLPYLSTIVREGREIQ